MPYMNPIKTNAEEVKRVVKAAFPSYNGRKISISTNIPSRLDSYWDGGSRDYYAFVQLSTLKAVELPTNHPFFEKDKPRDLSALPLGMAIVRHSIFCGKDVGCAVFVNPQDLNPKYLPSV